MRKALSYIFSVLALVSCETDSDIELSNHSQTVLTAFIYKDSLVMVHAYATTSYTDTTSYKPLDDVDVTMYINPPGEGLYRNINNGNISTLMDNNLLEYSDSIEIEVYDKEHDRTTVGRTRLIAPVKISKLSHTMQIRNETDTIISFTMTIKDPWNTTDYYQVVVRAKEETNDGSIIITPLPCDYSDYIFYIANSTLSTALQSSSVGLFNDEPFNGKTRNISFSIMEKDVFNSKKNKDSKMSVEVLLYHHTYDYYNYLHTALLAQNYLILPVFGLTSIHSNIVNGVGIVTGMTFDRQEIEIKR